MKFAGTRLFFIWMIPLVAFSFLITAILEQTDYLRRYRARIEWRRQADEVKRVKEMAYDFLGDDYIKQLEFVKQYEDLCVEQFIAGKKLGKFETIKDYIAFRKIEAVGREHDGFYKLIIKSSGNGYAEKLSYFLKMIDNYDKEGKDKKPDWAFSYTRLKKIISQN